jgi:putative membrane protein
MPPPESLLRDYYAAERTLLAWIRTTLAMMGFGFVVARFGVFLHEINAMNATGVGSIKTGGLSVWFGTALLLFGVLVNVIAVHQYRRDIHMLNAQAAKTRGTSMLALWTALGLAILGLMMAVYLIVISRATR